MHSYDLSPVECEILLVVVMDKLMLCEAYDCIEIAQYISNPRLSSTAVIKYMSKNKPLYKKRIIFHQRVTQKNLLRDRVLLLDPSLVKKVLDINESPLGKNILATTEKDLLKQIKKRAKLIKLKSHLVLSSEKLDTIRKINARMFNFHFNIEVTMENFPRWQLSRCLLSMNYNECRTILIALIGKHMGWFDSEDILFTRKGLSAACAKISGEFSPLFDEDITYLISNNWIHAANNSCSTNQLGNIKQQCF